MSEVILTFKGGVEVPLEVDCITPDLFQIKVHAEIEHLPIYHGNQRMALADFFEVKGERSDRIRIVGDLSKVRRIGQGMTTGRIGIQGSAGMNVGAGMAGGEILVEGDVDDWAGAEMRGGFLWIKGNAGNRAGSAYRGSKYGMRSGTILIEGGAGHEVGGYMRRGCIAVLGDVEDFAGARMVAGSLFLFGRTGVRTGGGMKRGSIVCFQEPALLPTFQYNCTYAPVFPQIFLRSLQRKGFPVKDEWLRGQFRRYNGDLSELGKGEILVWQGEGGNP